MRIHQRDRDITILSGNKIKTALHGDTVCIGCQWHIGGLGYTFFHLPFGNNRANLRAVFAFRAQVGELMTLGHCQYSEASEEQGTHIEQVEVLARLEFRELRVKVQTGKETSIGGRLRAFML